MCVSMCEHVREREKERETERKLETTEIASEWGEGKGLDKCKSGP